MQVMRLFGIPLRIDPLLVAVLLPAIVVGAGKVVAISFAVVLLHEICHALAARALGVKTHSIELMPFGGVAQMEDIRGGAEFLIALAGPVFNLLSAAALIWLGNRFPLYAGDIRPWLQAHMVIGLFNLIPAYPLDGGRMLRALISLLAGRETATRLCSWIGMGIGVVIAASGVATALQGLQLNLALVAIGGFVAVAAWRELQSLPYTALMNAAGKRRRMRTRPLGAKHIAAQYSTGARDVMRSFSAGRYHTVTVLDDDMDVMGQVGENDIVRAVADDGDISIGGILRLKNRGR